MGEVSSVFPLKFRGKTVKELYFPWDVTNGPGLEVELGPRPDAVGGIYVAFYDPRFLGERVSLAERAPWLVANTTLPLAHPLVARTCSITTLTRRIKTSGTI